MAKRKATRSRAGTGARGQAASKGRAAGVRSSVLGASWEERYLAALEKARAGRLLAEKDADRLRQFAGTYRCAKCRKEHRTASQLGKAHLALQPKAAEPPALPTTGEAEGPAQAGDAPPPPQASPRRRTKPAPKRAASKRAAPKPKARKRRS